MHQAGKVDYPIRKREQIGTHKKQELIFEMSYSS
jgi:hypothetical protein